MKKRDKENASHNILNNRMTKVTLAAALLLTGATTTISTAAPNNGLIGDIWKVDKAEAASIFSGGNGEAESPYLVADKTQLSEMRNYLSSHFKLISDIDLSDSLWTPIGTSEKPFKGKLDGDNHTINGLTINSTSDNAGLFGESSGQIENLHLTNVDVKGRQNVGGLIGTFNANLKGDKAYVENVSVTGAIRGTLTGVGGLIGTNKSDSIVKHIFVDVNVIGNREVGGIVGRSEQRTLSIENSYSKGTVEGTSSVGGLFGAGLIFINNVYSTSDVSGERQTGGLVGTLTGKLSNAYATGSVSGTSTSIDARVGGLVGYTQSAANNGLIENGFALNTSVNGAKNDRSIGKVVGYNYGTKTELLTVMSSLSGDGNSNDVDRVITDAEAMEKETYSGFDFGDDGNPAIWGIDEGSSAPYLMFHPDRMRYNPDTKEWSEYDLTDLIAATAAVERAEESKLQEDVDTARGLVDALSNSIEKTDLINRLNIVQKAIDDAKALAEQVRIATASVVKAEGSKLQVDVNTAKALVTALPNGTEKTDLTNRLNAVQKAIDDAKALAEQIAKATASVVKAEDVQTQNNIDIARKLVSELPNVLEKTELTSRLDNVQKLLDEKELIKGVEEEVSNLGDNPTQEELDVIKDKISELSDGPAKDVLLELIREKQEALDKVNSEKELLEQIDTATKAVEKAEISKMQVDVTHADNLVDKLPGGSVKTKLIIRLVKVQQIIDLASQLETTRLLVNKLGDNPTQVLLRQASLAVEELPSSADKSELTKLIKIKQDVLNRKIAEAKKAIEAIGTPPLLIELQNAKEKISLISAGAIKTSLENQINERQAQFDKVFEQSAKAEEAVLKAESFPTYFNITLAKKHVEVLPISQIKTSLEDRLQTIQDTLDVEKAEAKVSQAEKYERDPYLADAIQLVDALIDSESKQDLKIRIQAVVEKLKGINDDEGIGNSQDGEYNPDDLTRTIEDAIESIRDENAKKYFVNWNKAVLSAENYVSKTYIKNATNYLKELPSKYTSVASYENLIKELTERTQNLNVEEQRTELFASAEKAVAAYEKYQTNYYLKKAKETVNELPDSPEKSSFELRLGIGGSNEVPENGPIEEESPAQIAMAEKAVKNYEKYKTNYYLKKADEAVSLLVAGEEKRAFQERMDAVKK